MINSKSINSDFFKNAVFIAKQQHKNYISYLQNNIYSDEILYEIDKYIYYSKEFLLSQGYKILISDKTCEKSIVIIFPENKL